MMENSSIIVYTTGPYACAGDGVAGQVRYVNNQFECYSGGLWQPINISVDSPWVDEKIREEEELKRLLEKHPTLKKAHDQFEMIKALVQNGANEDVE